MTETILPGVQIEVRPEGLIVPGAVNIGNIGIIGTAANGPTKEPQLLSGYADAQRTFGRYDRWIDGDSGELTLVRALEQAYRFGASTVYAVRVASDDDAENVKATATVNSDSGPCVEITALYTGTVGNSLTVKVEPADGNALIRDEELTAGTLTHTPVVQSAQNRVVVRPSAGGADSVPIIVYNSVAGPGQVAIDTTTGAVTFDTDPGEFDDVLVTYSIDKASAVKVTVGNDDGAEAYNVVSGSNLASDLNRSSELAIGAALANANEPPTATAVGANIPLVGGTNGAGGANYQAGLDLLEGLDVHIILAAGQGLDFGDELSAHVERASGNSIQRERIAVVGSSNAVDFADLTGHSLNSGRVILVGPGVKANDNSQSPPLEVDLTGSYAAAAVAGKISSLSPHLSPTNKVLNVGGVEQVFNRAELSQLVQSRVLVLESRQGFRITKGITTATNTAWQQITTRRIVDFAKFGVRSAANPYIGLLNNERVRAAMRATINSVLATMVDDEMLVSYELDVSATRDEEIRGIARVELVLRPTFSIDFIKVTMFLE